MQITPHNNISNFILEGGFHSDERGAIAFANNFSFDKVKRFYRITHHDTKVIRAWQGHKLEQKWFHCISGTFEVQIAKIDNWESPSKNIEFLKVELSHSKSQILHIPAGYINGFRAMKPNSTLMIFSDKEIEESSNDDFRFDLNQWQKWQ